MAIIHCPECGEEVSNQATTCPHCGVKIFVCPECGHVSVNGGKCPNCGYSAGSEVSENDTAENFKGASVTIYERWLENDLQAKKREKTISSINYGLHILDIVLMAVCFFQVFFQYLQIDQGKFLSLTLNHQANLQKISIYYTVVLIFPIVQAVVGSFKDVINYYSCAKWIRRRNVPIGNDIAMLLEKEKSKNKKEEDDDAGVVETMQKEAREAEQEESLKTTLFLAVDPNQITFFTITTVIPHIFICILSIFILVWSKNTAVSYMDSVIQGVFEVNESGAIVFQMDFSLDWQTLLVGVVITMALVIGSAIICDFLQKRKIKSTLQKAHDAKSCREKRND